jgi:hypothetical protein
MKNFDKVCSIGARAALLALLASLAVFGPARADVAPPESPPGVIISPGSESTQVRMVSEVVTLTIISSGVQFGKAKTTAVFNMRNLGSSDESIAVRFPLTFGEALYYGDLYPEISDFKAQVGGRSVATSRITSVDENSGQTIPWASFSVPFPAGQEVKIAVSYTAQGFGYEPFLTFRYILETGAGWKDSIGAGDIIVQLPYPASPENVLIDSESGFAQAAGAPVFSGNEVSWHFENLEPTVNENFQIEMIAPATWKKVITERENTAKNPQDGEAWGRLGKAIKEAVRYPKGYLREDVGGAQLYAEAVQAYDRSVTLLPKDALWHYGFADLLWSHYQFSVYYPGLQDNTELTRIADELRLSLQIDPNNQSARDLAMWVSESLPWALSQTERGYDFLVLTATPTLLPETATPASEGSPEPSATAPAPEPTRMVDKTATAPAAALVATNIPADPQKTPTGGNPLCGSVLVLPFLLGLIWFVAKQ